MLDNVIGPQGLLAGRARILVTNTISFISQFDQLVYMRMGRIVESGTFWELIMAPGSEISRLVYVILLVSGFPGAYNHLVIVPVVGKVRLARGHRHHRAPGLPVCL